MKQEQIISIEGPIIYTNGGRRFAIGNADHKVGDWVWCDSGYIFGHSVPVNTQHVPNAEDVYIEMYDNKNNYYNFRLISIKTNGKKIIKDALCTVPITPTDFYGQKIYDINVGHFVYDSKGVAFFEYAEPKMNVYLFANGVWSKGIFDCINMIKAEFIDGDLYWSGAGHLNHTITDYKNLTAIKSLDFTNKSTALLEDFKSYAQGVLDDFILQHGTQRYILTDKDITKSWLPYYESNDIRVRFSILISTNLYENGGAYHSYSCAIDEFYLGSDIYQKARHLECDNIVYVNNEHLYTDIAIIYGVNDKYAILSSTRGTYYKLVDIVNNVTYDWTTFKAQLYELLNPLLGEIITITEVSADTLYIYITGMSFMFSKSQNTLATVDKLGFYVCNQQLIKIPKGVANNFIQAIKGKLGS